MPRENAQAKGRRYVLEGRLIVRRARTGLIEATCRGQGEIYQVGFRNGSWGCSCPARTRCAHLVALQLVTAIDPAGALHRETTADIDVERTGQDHAARPRA